MYIHEHTYTLMTIPLILCQPPTLFPTRPNGWCSPLANHHPFNHYLLVNVTILPRTSCGALRGGCRGIPTQVLTDTRTWFNVGYKSAQWSTRMI